MKIVITSGYFAPLHPGHLECLALAKKLGDHLIVIVNNDVQTKIKGSRHFMPEGDRLLIMGALKSVDSVFLSIDRDSSVCQSIEYIASRHLGCGILFAKGGDRFASNVPEVALCAKLGIKIVDGLGGKIRSSSEILASI